MCNKDELTRDVRQLLFNVDSPTRLMVDQRSRIEKSAPRKYLSVTTEVRSDLPNEERPNNNREERKFQNIVYAAWAALLHRYSGSDTVLFGANCNPTCVDQVFPLPVPICPTASVKSLIGVVDSITSQTEFYQNTSRQQMRVHCSIPTDSALFESAALWYGGSKEYAQRPPRARDCAVPLMLTAVWYDVLTLEIQYDTTRFTRTAIDRLLSNFNVLLDNILTDIDTPVSSLRLLTKDDEHRILDLWNKTEQAYPADKCLHELFETRVQYQPHAEALIHGSESMSYSELDQKSNRLANYLVARGVGLDSLVGISVERSIEAVIGVLGIAKAGAAYVPIDPDYPLQRKLFMLEDTSVPILVTQEREISELPEIAADIIYLDRDSSLIDQCSPEKPNVGVCPDHLCYCIFTSGSTGNPKGVLLDHRGRVNNFTDFNRRFEIRSGDRLLALSSLSFDMSAYDVFGILAAGATVVIPDHEATRDPSQWANLVVNQGVTVWHSVPALMEMYLDYIKGKPELQSIELRLALLGGDWIPLSLPDRIKAIAPDCRTISMGGATEVSMDSTIFEIDETDPEWKSIPYGFPMANQRVYVLDQHLQPVPQGVPGELYLGGIGVGRGYLNRKELTDERFLGDPFWSEPGARMYKTGDLVKFGEDGNLELLGRIDFQVKIRGFRIELGEIEDALRDHGHVRECVVMVENDSQMNQQLVAYLTNHSAGEQTDQQQCEPSHVNPPNQVCDDGYLRQTSQVNARSNTTGSTGSYTGDQIIPGTSDLRAYLNTKLPDYMVPARFVVLDSFPLTPNGKLDRKGLANMDGSPLVTSRAGVPPSNPVESVIASIWTDLLSLEQIDVTETFVDYGGSSLLAIHLMTQLDDIFAITISFSNLYQMSIQELAAEISRCGESSEIDVHAISKVYLEVVAVPDDRVDELLVINTLQSQS